MQFLAARSRWMKFKLCRYCIPLAICIAKLSKLRNVNFCKKLNRIFQQGRNMNDINRKIFGNVGYINGKNLKIRKIFSFTQRKNFQRIWWKFSFIADISATLDNVYPKMKFQRFLLTRTGIKVYKSFFKKYFLVAQSYL